MTEKPNKEAIDGLVNYLKKHTKGFKSTGEEWYAFKYKDLEMYGGIWRIETAGGWSKAMRIIYAGFGDFDDDSSAAMFKALKALNAKLNKEKLVSRVIQQDTYLCVECMVGLSLFSEALVQEMLDDVWTVTNRDDVQELTSKYQSYDEDDDDY